MTTNERLLPVLRDLAHTMLGRRDITDILDRLCDRTVDLLPVAGAGVMLFDERAGDGGQLLTVAASDSRIHAIERLQIDLSEGPCLDAWRTGQQVVGHDLVRSERTWPRFAPAAVQVGIQSVHSFPLRLEDKRVGALNLFGDEVVAFGEDATATAQLLADMATISIISNRALDSQMELSRQLQQALQGRVVIEQAKGKLSEALDVSVDAAFHHLRAYARRNRLALREIARRVVDEELDVTELRGSDPTAPV